MDEWDLSGTSEMNQFLHLVSAPKAPKDNPSLELFLSQIEK